MGVMVRPCAVTPGRTAPPPLRLASKLASLAASPIKGGGTSMMLLDVRVEIRDDLPRLVGGLDEPEEIEVARADHALKA